MERINELHTLAVRSKDFADAQRSNLDRRGARAGGVIGSLVAIIGALLTGDGLWLLMLGGSAYYILIGIGYVASGVLLWRRRAAGAWVAVALFAATVAWALWEVGLNYWVLYPRILPPTGLAFLALLATLRFPTNKCWRVAAHIAGVLGLLIGIQFAFAFVPQGAAHSSLSHHVALCSIAKSNHC
jgi:glucose dehydrogenase